MQLSPPHSHQSQGVVERYQQTIFAQLRTIKFSFCQKYNLEPRNISSHSTIYYITPLGYSTGIYPTATERHHMRDWKRPYNQPIINFGEKVYVEKLMPETQKLYRRNQEQKYEAIWIGRDTTTGQRITLTEEFGKLQTGTVLRLPREQQADETLLLKVTSLAGEYDNSKKKTDKDKTPPPRLYELKSPALPMAKPKTGNIQQEWHFQPPDQPTLDLPQRVPKFPTFPKTTGTIVQPPPGLQQQTPEPIAAPPEPILPVQPTTESTKEPTPQQQVQQPPAPPQVRRRITTKTTPAKNDLLATIHAGALRLTTNKDAEEKKLLIVNMILQEWYDDDNEQYDAYELKTAIKEVHDALQKTDVFTRVNAHDYNQQQLKDVIQTKWVICSRPGGKTKRLKARFVAKLGFTQKVNIDEIYAATPAAITLRIRLTLAQLRNHSIYMSDIQSAFLNTPVQPRTTILVKPPPECEQDNNILWKLHKQLYGLRDSPQKFQLHLSSILKQLGLRQLRSDQCVYHNDDITVMVYVDDLLLIGDDDKIKRFLKKLESQLQLKHVTKLQRDQPLVFLERQIEYYNDHIALSMTKDYYTSLLSLYNIKDTIVGKLLWMCRHSVRNQRIHKSSAETG
eukprot:6491433-Amphidinium_carterae.1